jgi:UDP-N-acetylmuramate: L-alanyl-gamma-D-glutamyl-meso-diaminopimelate ligase
MNVHFIAIGGAAMHNLAIALHNKGYQITGSDDTIFDPSKSRLHAKGLLPSSFGWYPEKISSNLDAIVLGMHAKSDNPELIKAQSLDLKIYSYPEFLFEQSKNKTRVVIGGSHGKTTITSMN